MYSVIYDPSEIYALKSVCARTLKENCADPTCGEHIRGLSTRTKCDYCDKTHKYVGARPGGTVVRACPTHLSRAKEALSNDLGSAEVKEPMPSDEGKAK